MEGRVASTHPFKVYTYNPDGSQGTRLLGGSYDNISAVTIACSVYQAMQQFDVDTWRQLGVWDSTNTLIAVIGAQAEAPTQTAPAALPVLSSLNPDSAGNWSVEVHALGQNFTPDAVMVSGGMTAATTFISSTELSFVVPGVHIAGVYPVKVRQASGESGELPFTAL